MTSSSAAAVILAAGLGTRMKSSLPKAAHKLANRPMLSHLLATAETVFQNITVVAGPEMERLAAMAAPHRVAIQAERLGTAHAALAAAAGFGSGDVAIIFADNPLIEAATLRRLLAARREAGAGLALMAMRPADPARYGRLVQDDCGRITRIVEWADATPEERGIGLCNAGALCGPADRLLPWLRQIRADNARGEYYLTDLVGLAVADGAGVIAVEAAEEELRGINSRVELAAAEAIVQQRLRLAAMEAGATLTAPETVFFSHDTQLAPDTVVGPHVVFGPGVCVEGAAEIRAFSHLEGCRVAAGAIVGPYARLRPGTRIGSSAHVGNFCELKAARTSAPARSPATTTALPSTARPSANACLSDRTARW
jgi:bifunctional UDP-N-acetylglucosamine pyrophosphorylase/glucosamine-1-phosphate N-acetyltransferase